MLRPCKCPPLSLRKGTLTSELLLLSDENMRKIYSKFTGTHGTAVLAQWQNCPRLSNLLALAAKTPRKNERKYFVGILQRNPVQAPVEAFAQGQ